MKFGAREWFYDYRLLGTAIAEETITHRVGKMAESYSRLTKSWNKTLNSEWTCRMYFASKMVLNATVLVLSHKHALSIGLHAAHPLFAYYACLSLCRCLVVTLPQYDWDNGLLFALSHEKAIHIMSDHVRTLSKKEGDRIEKMVRRLKAERELVSYRAPASGPPEELDTNAWLRTLVVLVEIAQLNSEILEHSVTKHTSKDTHEVRQADTQVLSRIQIDGHTFEDPEDKYRLGYLARKTKRPYNIKMLMSEGQVEDFIGAWGSDDADQDEPGVFANINIHDWQVIFDVP